MVRRSVIWRAGASQPTYVVVQLARFFLYTYYMYPDRVTDQRLNKSVPTYHVWHTYYITNECTKVQNPPRHEFMPFWKDLAWRHDQWQFTKRTTSTQAMRSPFCSDCTYGFQRRSSGSLQPSENPTNVFTSVSSYVCQFSLSLMQTTHNPLHYWNTQSDSCKSTRVNIAVKIDLRMQANWSGLHSRRIAVGACVTHFGFLSRGKPPMERPVS